jgi:hypothetical protein
MFTRKSLFVALTVIAMLAMLVPAAMAAPEQVAGVSIQSPTEANPVWVNSPGSFTVAYTINVTGSQVVPVEVTFQLWNLYDQVVGEEMTVVPVGVLSTGANALTYVFTVPAGLPDGLYHVRVCIDDGSDPLCSVQRRAVRVDNTPPQPVVLERPVMDEVCAWVTGTEYELFGYATDNFGVADAWFEYRADPANESLVIPATAVPGQPGEYWAAWNSTDVPDTGPQAPGFIRFCAEDLAGNVACSTDGEGGAWAPVCIENRVKVELEKGWNLISTPLLLYEPAISDVLENVWCPTGDPSCVDGGGWKYPYNGIPVPVDMIYKYDGAWHQWNNQGVDGVGTINDGNGYWVHTVAPATIEFIGTWLSIGPVAPPEYPVAEGWNLIGYTVWGRPTDQGDDMLVSEYLGFPMMWSVESMYRYNAALGRYIQVDEMTGEDTMVQGAGYWLALAEGTEGTINP